MIIYVYYSSKHVKSMSTQPSYPQVRSTRVYQAPSRLMTLRRSSLDLGHPQRPRCFAAPTARQRCCPWARSSLETWDSRSKRLGFLYRENWDQTTIVQVPRKWWPVMCVKVASLRTCQKFKRRCCRISKSNQKNNGKSIGTSKIGTPISPAVDQCSRGPLKKSS